MNCSQARALLAIYRELKKDQAETQELAAHLAECQACDAIRAQYDAIGAQVRTLPTVVPPPEAHTKLMHALAAEHVRFIQRAPASAASTPTPSFLAPYLQDLTHNKTPQTQTLVAFSTADTGPLPVIRPLKRRPIYRMNHATIIGVAASFLIMLMVGGLASFLTLTSNLSNGTDVTTTKINTQEVQSLPGNATTALYPFVASAVADGKTIYYTAYGTAPTAPATATATPGATATPQTSTTGSAASSCTPTSDTTTTTTNTTTSTGTTAAPGVTCWTLEQYNTDSSDQKSIPLLSLPTTSKLFVLGSAPGWLVWLKEDLAPTATASTSDGKATTAYTWSLYIHPLTGNAQPISDKELASPLLQGTFDQSKVPGWVNRPIQGTWLNQHTLLVAMIDAQGTSHLYDYNLDLYQQCQLNVPDVTEGDVNCQAAEAINTASADPALSTSTQIQSELAHADHGHILTSPTSNTSGTSIYWSDEWSSTANSTTINSNVWTRQVSDAPVSQMGRWAAHPLVQTYQFTNDGKTFRPQLIDDTLFLLNQVGVLAGTTPNPTPTQVPATTTAGTATPQASATAIAATPTPTPAPNVTGWLGGTVSFDPTATSPQIDEAVTGRIATFTADGVANTLPLFNSKEIVSAIQSGSRFLIWQDSARDFQMYDVETSSYVRIGGGNVPNGASFLQLSGNTAIWITNPTPSTQPASSTGSNVSFGGFKWPQ